MPIEVISGEEAVRRMGRIAEARWPTKPRDAARMYPFARPECQPTFSIEPNSRVFTIGSCFARNIEKYLEQFGFQVPTLKMREAEGLWHSTGDNVLNKYTPQSMLNELVWALESGDEFSGVPGARFPDPEGYVEDKEDAWVDLQLPVGGTGTDLETCRKRRRMVLETHREIRTCQTVIITLGLTEVWFDKLANVYLNRMPPKYAIEKHAGRFEFHVLDHRDILDNLQEMYSLLRKHNPLANILITVSPVPFVFTFRAMDALVANMYSKSALRAALEEFVFGKEKIDYFPSYETVMLSERGAVWRDDRLHVTDSGVGAIMQKVLQAYAGVDIASWESALGRAAVTDIPDASDGALESASNIALEDLLSQARLARQKKDWNTCSAAAAAALRLAQHGSPGFLNAHVLAGVAAVYMKDPKRARKHLVIATENGLQDEEVLAYLGDTLLLLQQNVEVVERLSPAVEKSPGSTRLMCLIGRAYLKEKDEERAIRTFEKSCAAKPDDGWAKWELARALADRDRSRAVSLAMEAKALLPNSKNLATAVNLVLGI